MKKIVLLLVVACAALLPTHVWRAKRADALLETAQKETLTVSNQLSETQMKVNHQERMNAALRSQLAERESNLADWSNTVAQLRATLATTRAALDTARAEIPPAIARSDTFAAERNGFSNRVQEVEATLRQQETQLREAREQTVAEQSELAAVSHRLADERASRMRLESLLADPTALRAHLADARQRAAAENARPSGRPDFHQRVQLLADGTVVLWPTLNAREN